jgi:hypothetical protein
MVRRSIAVIVYPLLLAALLVTETAAQRPPKKNPRLHAGIRAQIIAPSTDTPSVMLLFVLLNDSEKPLDVEARSWTLVLNGKDLNDSGMLFGNGPMPVGGYRILKPGESYEFGKALPIAEYFPSNGQYKVKWKGAAFQSPTITVTITPASH